MSGLSFRQIVSYCLYLVYLLGNREKGAWREGGLPASIYCIQAHTSGTVLFYLLLVVVVLLLLLLLLLVRSFAMARPFLLIEFVLLMSVNEAVVPPTFYYL